MFTSCILRSLDVHNQAIPEILDIITCTLHVRPNLLLLLRAPLMQIPEDRGR